MTGRSRGYRAGPGAHFEGTMDDNQKPSIQRRSFIQTAALGLGATVAASAAVTASGTARITDAADDAGAVAAGPTEGSPSGAAAAGTEYDLIIVGAGTAGLPAAIQAADLGARVAVLDKNPAIGGMLHVSGGQLSAANSRMQIQKGFIDSPSAHYRDALKIGKYKNSSELVKLDVDNAGPVVDWLQEIGVEFTPESPVIYYGHEVYSVPRTHMPLDAGRTILEAFRKEFDARVASGGVDLLLG